MLEEAMLREQFLALLDQQQTAAQVYADLAAADADTGAYEQVEQIAREKKRHVELTQRLLEIVD